MPGQFEGVKKLELLMADHESDTYGNIDTPMSASVARLHPSDPHSLWDQKQFVWFVVLAALGLILVLIETVRQIV